MAFVLSLRRSTIPLLAILLAMAVASSAPHGVSQSTARETVPANFETLSRQAMDALNADNLDKAEPLFRKALALNPKWAEGWWSLGTSFYDQNRFAEASLAFQKVVALDPTHGTAHALLGLSLFELGDDAGALKNIEESKKYGTSVDPQLRDVIFYHEGVLLQRKGLFEAAQKPFSSLCLGGNRNPQLLQAFGMAALHMRSRNFPVPGTEAQRVVATVGQAACLAAHHDFDIAKSVFTQAIATYPNFPFLHFAFGRELLAAHEIPDAIEQFKLELKIAAPLDRVISLLQIAAAEYKVDSAAGMPYVQKAIALDPNSPFPHFLLGLLLMDTGAYQKAIPELQIARKGMPEDTKVLWVLSTAYSHVGRMHDAAEAREKFLALKQKDSQQAAGENPDVPVETNGEAPR
ncbi:MAG: tetratricopeptide repeat protein [Acidobacteriota bacterium]|nr:tetratricopeptide repeat protein [Acidobacteriota bacterium]